MNWLAAIVGVAALVTITAVSTWLDAVDGEEYMTTNEHTTPEPTTPLRTVPVFVYGSLRPNGGGANGMMENGKVAGPFPAIAQGRLHYHECGAYPVLSLRDTDDIVRGDVYLMDADSYEFHWVDEMEVGAGYEPEYLDVWALQSDGKVGHMRAMTYAWWWHTMGPRITSGDWVTADKAPWPERVSR